MAWQGEGRIHGKLFSRGRPMRGEPRRGWVWPGAARQRRGRGRIHGTTKGHDTMSTTATALHPFDFAKLSKGTWIETDELERAAMRKRTHPVFGRAVLRVREQIESITGILSRVEGERLRLMTDGEAVVWLIRESGRASVRLERNAHRLRHNVDRARLTAAEQVTHEHATRVISMMAEAQRAERQRSDKLFSLACTRLPRDDDDE